MPQLLAQPSAVQPLQYSTHQRNFPFVQPLAIRVTTSPVQSPPFPQPSLKPTSFLPIFRRRGAPGTRSRQPKNSSLCVDSRALAEACRCELRPFPFPAPQIQWSLTKSRSLDFGTTTIVETGTTGLDSRTGRVEAAQRRKG